MMLLNQINTKLLISSLLIVFLQFSFSQEKIKVDGISSVIGDFIILDSDIDKVLIDMESQGLSTRGISRCQLLGKLMEDKMGEKYVVKFNSDNKTSYGFEDLAKTYNIYNQHGVKDYHFTKEGNQIVARNVIEHIEKHNILHKNDFYETKGIKKSI